MIPTIALIGRSNVGKSSLFNLLTKSHKSLVDSTFQTTRDCNYGYFSIQKNKFCIIDTAGIEYLKKNKDLIYQKAYEQTRKSIKESNFLIFIVDTNTGITTLDSIILKKIRKKNKPIFLLVNKIDLVKKKDNIIEFYRFGIKNICLVSVLHRIGINNLLKKINLFYENFKEKLIIRDIKEKKINPLFKIKICLVGKPNVGKSSIINSILNNNRIITSPLPGTTRDLITVSLRREKILYLFTDTIGIKKKNKTNTKLEKISLIKSIQVIKKHDIVVVVIDAHIGIGSQDLSIISYIIKKGYLFFIIVNKWDLIPNNKKKIIQDTIKFRLKFIKNIKILYVSAHFQTGFKKFFSHIFCIYKETLKEFSALYLTNQIKKATLKHPLPLGVTGKVIRLKYAHIGGKNPIFIIVHGTNTQDIPLTYKKYLMRFLQQALQIPNTPIRLFFKNGLNPYHNKKNKY